MSASLGVRDSNEASWTQVSFSLLSLNAGSLFMPQVLDVCEYMSDATNIPILLDGDTGLWQNAFRLMGHFSMRWPVWMVRTNLPGFGNFNNARRLVRKLEHRGVAAVCLEDKVRWRLTSIKSSFFFHVQHLLFQLFPKTNSFIDVEGGEF